MGATIPCVVLAGGKARPEIQAATGQSNRALAVINGQTLLGRVVEALRAASPPIGPITVVGDVPESADYARLPDSGGFVENLFAGLSAHSSAPFILVAASDLPFLTGEAVAGFVQGAVAQAEREPDIGFVYPVVPVAACYARFPDVRRTSLRLREGEFTGGNLMLVRPHVLLRQRQRIGEAYAARKSPLRLAMMIGLGTLARLLVSQTLAPGLLTVPFLEARISRLIGSPARALICRYPEIATDIDRPEDFSVVGLAPPATGRG
ncbi:MAG TPA: nucleotidyltransferase family protein [Chthonomonadaceae bacterium]|nr:nucleotidyltransferase family protein [Chthonomonadaceae bacterium]